MKKVICLIYIVLSAATIYAQDNKKEVYADMKGMYNQIDEYIANQTGQQAHSANTEEWKKMAVQLMQENQRLHQRLDSLELRLLQYNERLSKFEVKKATEHEAFSTILELILFEQASFKLDDKSRQQIASVASVHSDKKLRLVAYTDRKGNDELNKTLAYERALAVQNELIHDGFKPAQIEIDSKGKFDESQQSISDQECRRVEIRY